MYNLILSQAEGSALNEMITESNSSGRAVMSHGSYVLFSMYEQSTQEYLQTALTNFSQIRDYHGQSSPEFDFQWSIMYVLSNCVAEAVNATLIATHHPNYDPEVYPTILPGVQPFGRKDRTVDGLWRRFYPSRNDPTSKVETTQFARIDGVPLNFMYCAIPRARVVPVWSFSFLAQPFDRWTWLVLAVLFISVSLVIGAATRKLTRAVFTTLSVLVSPGLSGLPPPRSLMFVLWMLACTVLAFFYSAVMTSQVISPPSEVLLSTLRDVEQNGYQLIFADSITRGLANATMSVLNSKDYVPSEVSTLDKLLKMSNTALIPADDIEFARTLLNPGKPLASIFMWPYAMERVHQINQFISSKNASSEEKKWRCYVGKELVSSGEMYFAFLPPRNGELAQAFIHLEETGVVARWFYEFFAIAHSRRVQDRIRFRDPTHITQERPGVIRLQMEGNTVTIFLLWIICLVTCGIVNGIECFANELKTIFSKR